MTAGRKTPRPRAAFRPVEQPAKRVGDAGGGWAGKKGRRTPKQRYRGTGLCRTCGRLYPLRLEDAKLRKHRDRLGAACAGAGTLPSRGSVKW